MTTTDDADINRQQQLISPAQIFRLDKITRVLKPFVAILHGSGEKSLTSLTASSGDQPGLTWYRVLNKRCYFDIQIKIDFF